MPKDDTNDTSAPMTSSSKQQKESAPTVSDAAYPKGRGPGDFGTHGGKNRGAGLSPKQVGKKVEE